MRAEPSWLGNNRRAAGSTSAQAAGCPSGWTVNWSTTLPVLQDLHLDLDLAAGGHRRLLADQRRGQAGTALVAWRRVALRHLVPGQECPAVGAELGAFRVLVPAVPADDHPTTSTLNGTWAGRATATSASSRRRSTPSTRPSEAAPTGVVVRTRTISSGSARPRAVGRLGRPRHLATLDDLRSRPGGQFDQLRQAADGAPPAEQLTRPLQEPASLLPCPGVVEDQAEPAPEPVEEVCRRQGRVQVGAEVVEGAEHGRRRCRTRRPTAVRSPPPPAGTRRAAAIRSGVGWPAPRSGLARSSTRPHTACTRTWCS